MKILLLFLLLLPCKSHAQKAATAPLIPRYGIALNLAPLVSGSPELQADYFFHRNIGAIAATGISFHPTRGAVKLDDNAELESLQGYYWKLGIKGRYQGKNRRGSGGWLQLLYIGSQYEEKGTVDQTPVTHSGTVHGYAAALGGDIYLWPRFDLRIGLQVGYYKRKDHLGKPVMTFQPGFGKEVMLPCPTQFNLGISYRIGSM